MRLPHIVATPKSVSLLEVDPELAGDLVGADFERALASLVAPLLHVEQGPWTPPPDGKPAHLGLLVLDGLFERHALLAGIGCTELIGKGDLIRPWMDEEGTPSLPFETSWRTLEPARLAVLDGRVAIQAAPWPTIGTQLARRAARLTDSLAVHFAITCFVGLELRLYLLFWHLADRFGRVEADGVHVPLPLTHETLARLVRARRPSVSTALQGLLERGLLAPSQNGGWLLHGDPANELERLRDPRGGDVRDVSDSTTGE